MKRTNTASVQSRVGRLQPVDGNQEDELDLGSREVLEDVQEVELHEEESAQEAKHIIPPPKHLKWWSHNVSHLPLR